MKSSRTLIALLLVALCGLPSTAQAHFLWLVIAGQDDAKRLEVYFSETAEPGEPELLGRIQSPRLARVTGEKVEPLKLNRSEDSLHAALQGDAKAIYVLSHDYGVITRGDDRFLLKYYAKTGPAAGSPAWQQSSAAKALQLDVVPQRTAKGIQLTATFGGKPAAGAQVVIEGPDEASSELEMNEQGQVTWAPQGTGLYSIRVRHIQQEDGEFEGEKYAEARHYTTLALPVANLPAGKAAKALPEIPQAVTSFGGAIAQGNVYIYGGHMGEAHSYYSEAQANKLWRLNLNGKPQWKQVAEGPRRQGLAMVAHDGKLYRLGGFIAKNEQDEERDLWSQADVARFDPADGGWSQLPPLPEPRSSFDAAVLGDVIYVIGGWALQGDGESQWHKTAYALDLSADELAWKALPEQPFVRRALSVAAHGGKIYAIGGMRQKGGPTTEVDVYDPATKTWWTGPALPGEGMEGFGSAAFAAGDRLYVSTYSGQLLRLAADGQSWEKVRQLENDRFFHRMLPVSSTELLMVGGASMSSGKFTEVELISVD